MVVSTTTGYCFMCFPCNICTVHVDFNAPQAGAAVTLGQPGHDLVLPGSPVHQAIPVDPALSPAIE